MRIEASNKPAPEAPSGPSVQVLNPAFDLAGFAGRVRTAPRRVLLLDFDGTLAPFVVERLSARPYPGVRERLSGIAADGRTRLGIVSGRFVRELAALVQLPIEMWGSHGLERLTAKGVYSAAVVPAEARRWISHAAKWVSRQPWGRVLERKPFGFSLHGRGTPRAFAAARASFVEKFGAAAKEVGLRLHDFDGGLEVRPGQGDKGAVVAGVLDETGDGAPLAYLGDDETDEDAFRALRGRGMGALARQEARSTLADVFLRTPDELLPFLDWWSGEDPGR